MFTKSIGQIWRSTHHSRTTFNLEGKNHMCCITMKKLTFYRFHAVEVTTLDKKEISSRTQFNFSNLDLYNKRNFFQFNGNSQGWDREYQGKKLVGYSSGQMFDVVADVGSYQNFLPFCKKSHVTFRSATNIKADLMIGFPPLVESYTSNVSLVKPQLIKAVCSEGKLFNYLLTTWKFSPGLKNSENTSIIDFYVSFKFKSALHSHLANIFFNELVWQMENAFYQEAQRRYGEPIVKMQTLNVSKRNS